MKTKLSYGEVKNHKFTVADRDDILDCFFARNPKEHIEELYYYHNAIYVRFKSKRKIAEGPAPIKKFVPGYRPYGGLDDLKNADYIFEFNVGDMGDYGEDIHEVEWSQARTDGEKIV